MGSVSDCVSFALVQNAHALNIKGLPITVLLLLFTEQSKMTFDILRSQHSSKMRTALAEYLPQDGVSDYPGVMTGVDICLEQTAVPTHALGCI